MYYTHRNKELSYRLFRVNTHYFLIFLFLYLESKTNHVSVFEMNCLRYKFKSVDTIYQIDHMFSTKFLESILKKTIYILKTEIS